MSAKLLLRSFWLISDSPVWTPAMADQFENRFETWCPCSDKCTKTSRLGWFGSPALARAFVKNHLMMSTYHQLEEEEAAQLAEETAKVVEWKEGCDGERPDAQKSRSLVPREPSHPPPGRARAVSVPIGARRVPKTPSQSPRRTRRPCLRSRDRSRSRSKSRSRRSRSRSRRSRSGKQKRQISKEEKKEEKHARTQQLITSAVKEAVATCTALSKAAPTSSSSSSALAIMPMATDDQSKVLVKIVEHVAKSCAACRTISRMARQAGDAFDAEGHNLQSCLETLQDLCSKAGVNLKGAIV